MAVITQETESIIDSAMGPLRVYQAKQTGFDIDDFVSTTVSSQATYLNMINILNSVDPKLAQNRPPVRLGAKQVGGY